jgi:hypothetical protein
MKEHLKDWGPGWRFFQCECRYSWVDKSRDCTSPSGEDCPSCHEFVSPYKNEPHYEWPTDRNGNLLEKSQETDNEVAK